MQQVRGLSQDQRLCQDPSGQADAWGSKTAHLCLKGKAAQGHMLALVNADNGDQTFFCVLCGRWATTVARHLREPCLGELNDGGKDVLSRVGRGLHPRKSASLIAVPSMVPWFEQHGSSVNYWLPKRRLHCKTSCQFRTQKRGPED